jgi:microcystin degradation protein MlrC
LYSSYVAAKHALEQPRPADAVRPGLNRLDIALAGNCDFGGPLLYLGLLRHHQRAQPGGRAALEAGLGAELDLALGQSVSTFGGRSDAPVRGRFEVLALSDGVCTLKGPMMRGLTVRLGPSACLEIEGIRVAVVSGKKQLLARELLRMVGIHTEQMRVIVVKSSVHFRVDFQPHASHVLVAKAPGPMAAVEADLPWKKLSPSTRRAP